MRFKLIITMGLVCIFIFSATSIFGAGVGLTGIGARATALAGCYRGVANDWSAMYWNPAGLTQIKGMHVGGSFEMVTPGAKYTLSQNVPPFGVYKTSEFENESKTFYIPAFGVVYGTEKMSFGLSVYAPFGLGSEWDAMNTSDYNSQYPEFDFFSDLQIIDIHPTFAYQVSEKLSVGVGFSFVLADIAIRSPKTTMNSLLFDPANAALKQGVLEPMGLAESAFDYNYILTESELEGTGTGFGFNFGIKYDLTEDFSIGLSGCYYNDIILDGKISATTYFEENNIDPAVLQQLSGTLDGMIAAGLLDEASKKSILGVYSGQKDVVYDKAPGEATLPLPMTLGVGLAYTGIENLLVSTDISWTQWSSWDIINIDMDNGVKSELVENWEDGIRFGLGLEYKLMEPLTFRAGYYTEPSAIPDETLSITIADINRRHAINAGLSYKLGMLDLYASYEKIIIGDREVDNWVPSSDKTDYENMAGTYKMTVNNIMFGIGYNF